MTVLPSACLSAYENMDDVWRSCVCSDLQQAAMLPYGLTPGPTRDRNRWCKAAGHRYPSSHARGGLVGLPRKWCRWTYPAHIPTLRVRVKVENGFAQVG